MNSDTVLRLLNAAIHRGTFILGKKTVEVPVEELEAIKRHILKQGEDLTNLRDDITDMNIPKN